MTRRRLWSLTALACALLMVPSLPHLPPAVAGLLLLAPVALVAVRRRRRSPSDLAVVMARRGRPVAAIARRTRLAQDAVRDLLGGEPMAVSTAPWGRFFRRRKPATPVGGASFAEELSERSFDAKA